MQSFNFKLRIFSRLLFNVIFILWSENDPFDISDELWTVKITYYISYIDANF